MAEEEQEAAVPSMEQVMDEDSAPSEEIAQEQQTTDNTEQAEQSTDSETEESKVNPAVQKRINQITREKYDLKRQVDAQQRKISELQDKSPVARATSKAPPTLEDYDYDDGKYQDALIEYKAERIFAQKEEEQRKAYAERQRRERDRDFAQRIEKSGIPDYTETITELNSTIALPDPIIDVIQADEKGPELAYHLGKNLDVADRIANMNPLSAAVELGRISASLAKQPGKKVTSAPKPVNAVASGGGGSPNKSYEDMSMDEIMKIDI